MNARHFIFAGIGLALLVGGCTQDGPQARRRFEVSPDTSGDAPVARPVPQLAFTGPTGSSADAVKEKVKSAHRALENATPPDAIPTQAPEVPDETAAVTPRAAVPASGVDWLNPDHFTLSNTPGARAPTTTARRPVRQQPSASDQGQSGVQAEPSVANQGTQIVRPPPAPASPPIEAAPVPAAPVPAPPVPASALMQASSGNPAFASLPGTVTATALADPDPLGHKFAQRMRDYPTDVAAHFDYQMLRFLRDQPVPELDTISTLPSEDREMLTAVMDALSNFRSGLRANRNMLLSEKIKPLLDLADRVRSQAELTIPVIAICSRVQGFGVYDPMPTTLRAGVDNPVIIYCEVANFASQQDEKGMWETKLSQEAVLYTDTGYPAWRDKSDIPVDLSRNRRHDFFVVKKVTLPRNLNIGRYNLKVSIVDEQVKRIAENSAQIQLMAQ